MAADDVRREHGYHPLRIKRRIEETPDAATFVLEVPAGLTDLFAYHPGQFCTFRVRDGAGEHLRCYSMSSAPETDADLAVTVKRVPGGIVSNWLLDNAVAGGELEVNRPAGHFCVHDTGRPVVAVCGGSGITPVLSIAKSLLASTERPVRLLYANRDRPSVIFADELDRLAAAHPDRFEVHHHLDADGGFLDPAAVTAFAEGSLHADFYVCGPAPLMDLVESTLLGLGVEQERINIERFVVASPEAPAPSVDPVGGDDVPAEVTIILKGKRHTVTYQPGDTILQTARRGGLPAPFSCEAGDCATCMAQLREGEATMRVNNALTPEEVADRWVLTCQALPRGPEVTVEYESF